MDDRALWAIADELEALRERVRRNLPRHRCPEAFHEEKSEITGCLTRIIGTIRRRTGRIDSPLSKGFATPKG